MIYDNFIIGGGFFGLYLSEFLSKKGKSVIICEKENDFMQRASKINQARIHNGYHYPRNALTALRSRISFPKFTIEFSECVESSFEKYYAIGKILGKITGKQFYHFCKSINAQCSYAPQNIQKMFNSNLVEDVFKTNEFAFSTTELKNIMQERINQTNTNQLLGTKVESIEYNRKEKLFILQCADNLQRSREFQAKQIFNCTYSQINQPLKSLPNSLVPLKHELAEMCLVEVPEEFKRLGITIMCGPFFSIMPFPDEGLHTLSHVRYTPHFEWSDKPGNFTEPHEILKKFANKSSFRHMIKDASRYVPALECSKYHRSLWEVKTVLPKSEENDSRPILFKPNHLYPRFHTIMGGKIDNVYEMIHEIEEKHELFNL